MTKKASLSLNFTSLFHAQPTLRFWQAGRQEVVGKSRWLLGVEGLDTERARVAWLWLGHRKCKASRVMAWAQNVKDQSGYGT